MPLFRFSISLKVQERDVNLHHVSHEKYFLFFQEARICYLAMFDDAPGKNARLGVVISDVRCEYKKELFLGDEIEVKCRISRIRPKAFVMQYHTYRETTLCAVGSTTYLCFDYGKRKVASFPNELVRRIKEYEGLG